MAEQKIENLLNVSLEVNEEEREKSPSLSTGFNEVQRTWEIIVRFQGNIEEILVDYPDIQVRTLSNNYAIIITPQQYVESIANETYIEFMEKPKRLFFELSAGKSASCVNQVQQGVNNPYQLFGAGVIVAVIDTGINLSSQQFRNADGTTRILNIWDQETGIEWNQEQINQFLRGDIQASEGKTYSSHRKSKVNVEPRSDLRGMVKEQQIQGSDVPGRDLLGHGTDVAQIACGRDGVASQADLIIVKMGIGTTDGFPRTTQLMEALDYVVQKGIEYGKPVAVNISFGNNYGDHTGRSLLETYMNEISNLWKCSICVGTGNEGLGATHNGGVVSGTGETEIEFVISEYEASFNMQIWKNFWDEFDVEIIAPGERNLGRIGRYNTVNRVNVLGTTVLTYRGLPSPYSSRQEIYIDMIPEGANGFILSGGWKIRFIPIRIVEGRYDCWMPSIGSLNIGTGFLRPDGSLSITIPSTAQNVISVGAYNGRTGTPAAFSGRGYVSQIGGYVMSKPELVAPGVGVQLRVGKSVSGTSYATPFVTGAAALLMEWGIVKGNDPFLYGEKMKACLIKGARPLGLSSPLAVGSQQGIQVPNSVTGWGALCVRDSLPV